MSKHQRTAGVDFRTVEINGKQYTLRPLTIGVYASMEAFIVSQRPDPLAIASESVKRLPASHHDAVWKAAMKQAVDNRTVEAVDAAAFENSVTGLSWKVWQCLKQDHPEIDSVDAARSLIIEAGESRFEELANAVEVASGEADSKNYSGPAEAAPAGGTDQAGQ